jgi:hypothetical protein
MSALSAPPWQELSELLQHWSGAVMCPACLCGREAAGHNAMRGSGPNQKHAFKDALTHTGCPDPRIDLVCITSSVLANSFNFKRHRRCLSHLLGVALLDSGSLQHFDAPERAPSTASKADIGGRLGNVRFTPKSRHSPTASGCLLCARSRHCGGLGYN